MEEGANGDWRGFRRLSPPTGLASFFRFQLLLNSATCIINPVSYHTHVGRGGKVEMGPECRNGPMRRALLFGPERRWNSEPA